MRGEKTNVFSSTKRRQNEAEITEMDHSLRSFVRVPCNHSKMDVKTYRKHHEKDQISECLRQMMITNRLNWNPKRFKGFPADNECWRSNFVGGNDEDSQRSWTQNRPNVRRVLFAWLPRISRCFMLQALWAQKQLRIDQKQLICPLVCFHFVFQILHINTQLPASVVRCHVRATEIT